MSDQRRLRCRIGLHRWTQFKQEDPDLDNPGQSATWLTKCRDCGVERGSGVRPMLAVTATLALAGVLVWWLVSGLLGVVLILGAVVGVGWTALAVWLSTYNRRVGFRYRG